MLHFIIRWPSSKDENELYDILKLKKLFSDILCLSRTVIYYTACDAVAEQSTESISKSFGEFVWNYLIYLPVAPVAPVVTWP